MYIEFINSTVMKKILIWLLVGFALVTLGTCAFTFYYISTGAVTPQEISSEQTSRDSLLNSLGNKQIDSTVLAKIPNHTLLQNGSR